MTPTRRIIGISLLRNEEYYALWSLNNVLDFCDEIIILDNQSTDGTSRKVEAFAERHPGVSVHSIPDPHLSHDYIKHYAGEDVWVFGVDGDEVYDPVGLARLRQRILAGEFQEYWTLAGYMLHAVKMDLESGRAEGYISPHSPRGNKLHNFSALISWEKPGRQRLHGPTKVFRPGYHRKDNLDLFAQAPWESCDLRALHLCFFPRSSHDTVHPALRKNPSTLRVKGVRKIQRRVKDFIAAPFSKTAGYKTRRYARGPIVNREIASFGRPSLDRYADPDAAEAEKVMALRHHNRS
ncbi:MAG: hypothetical protein WD960_08010 [Gemmatimonadota bacterium]